MYLGKENRDFENFTANINRIIKVKWEALEEMEISLPKIATVAKEVIENRLVSLLNDYLHSFRGLERYDKCFIYPEIELKDNRVNLMYMTPDGPEIAVVFNIEESVKFPGVAKNVSFECKTFPQIKSIEELFDFVCNKVENADIFSLWTNLPISEREKERNFICPECGNRNSIYVGNFGSYYAFTCSWCDFTGKGRPDKSDAIKEWAKEKNSDFQKARSYHLKHQSFKEISKQSLESIDKELCKLAELKRNKKVVVTDDDVSLIKSKLLSSVERTIDELSGKKKTK